MGTVSFGGTRARSNRVGKRSGVAVFAMAGAVLAILGAVILATVPWQQMVWHLQARSWPVVEARILSVSLVEERYADPRGNGFSSELVLSAAYEFEVAGNIHAGYAASLSDRADPHDRRLRMLYGKLLFAKVTGRTVPVFHDPEEPEYAYLDIDFAWRQALLRGGLGFGFVLAGLCLLAVPLRPARIGGR